MKTPLRFQITEYDCGRASLINCISFLFEREEIPVELLKAIQNYTLDNNEHGTSRDMMQYFAKWLTTFSEKKEFGIKCKYTEGEDVNFDKIQSWIKAGGVVNFRCWHFDYEHYVMISKIDKEFVYIFDPYYLEEDCFEKDKNIGIIFQPKSIM